MKLSPASLKVKIGNAFLKLSLYSEIIHAYF